MQLKLGAVSSLGAHVLCMCLQISLSWRQHWFICLCFRKVNEIEAREEDEEKIPVDLNKSLSWTMIHGLWSKFKNIKKKRKTYVYTFMDFVFSYEIFQCKRTKLMYCSAAAVGISFEVGKVESTNSSVLHCNGTTLKVVITDFWST